MNYKFPILEDKWLIKTEHSDEEYYEYLFLAAKCKYDKMLENNDFSAFYEIVFHVLNINNVLLEGRMFNFMMNPETDNSKLMEIRNAVLNEDLDNEHLKLIKTYHSKLTIILKKYLMLQADLLSKNSLLSYVNSSFHLYSPINLIIKKPDGIEYDIYEIKVDKRKKVSMTLDKLTSLSIDSEAGETLNDKINEMKNPKLNKIDPDVNTILCMNGSDKLDNYTFATLTYNLILLNNIIGNEQFNPNLMADMYMTLKRDNVMPYVLV